jgi:small subunit ribosomal protein S18
MVMTPPAAPTAPRPAAAPGRRRPGEFGSGRKFTPRRKVCAFCVDKIKIVDYKDLARLRRFLSERGKIEPRRKTGTCAAHQRSLNVALKNARLLALLPFTAEHIRVTGVPAREPGGPMLRGGRAARLAETGELPEAEVTENGEATAEGTPPSPESPETVAESSAAQGTRDTPATGPTQP